MKKILGMVMLAVLLTVSISHAEGKNIYVVHEDTPKWVEQTLGSNGTDHWITEQYAYGVGVVPKMKNRSLQRTAAGNRARNVLLKNFGQTEGVLRGTEIRHIWEDPSTGKIHALARMPIKIVPAK